MSADAQISGADEQISPSRVLVRRIRSTSADAQIPLPPPPPASVACANFIVYMHEHHVDSTLFNFIPNDIQSNEVFISTSKHRMPTY